MLGAESIAMAWSSLLVLATLAMAPVDGAGSVGAPAPSMDCTDALLSLAGCLSYVQEGSTAAKPEATCCSGLKKVVKEEVACLCQAFDGSKNFGVNLNMTRALELPSACKVKTPPFSKCHISIPGVTGEAPAPAPSSGESPSHSSLAPSAGSDTAAHAPPPSRSPAVRPPAPLVYLFANVAASLLAYHLQ